MFRILAALALALLPSISNADAIATVSQGSTVVTFFDEPCALKPIQLPYRTTWRDGDKVTEGCFGLHGSGVVVIYFEDGSVGLVPREQIVALQPGT
jgi:hypothetical protein